MRLKRLLLWALLPLAVVLIGGWMVSARSAEDRTIAGAARLLEQGRAEDALLALEPLRRRRLLSRPTRRRAAELYFRLGEDKKALGMLAGQTFNDRDPADRYLQEMSARCLRAAALLERAARSRDPEERIRLSREAVALVPESPRVLHHLVREEWLATLFTEDPKIRRDFEHDYRILRRMAPRLSDGLQAEVRAALEEQRGEVR